MYFFESKICSCSSCGLLIFIFCWVSEIVVLDLVGSLLSFCMKLEEFWIGVLLIWVIWLLNLMLVIVVGVFLMIWVILILCFFLWIWFVLRFWGLIFRKLYLISFFCLSFLMVCKKSVLVGIVNLVEFLKWFIVV